MKRASPARKPPWLFQSTISDRALPGLGAVSLHPPSYGMGFVDEVLPGGALAPAAPLPAATGVIQRQPTGEVPRLQLEEPVFGRGLGWQGPRLGLDLPRLRVGPDPEAEAAAARVRALIDPDFVRRSMLQLDLAQILAPQPPPWLRAPAVPEPPPLVPRGAGPATPRPASAGDVIGAIMAIPAVRAGVEHVRDEATARLRRDWRSLSTGERVAVITAGVVVGGGAIAGIATNPEARQLALQQIQGRTLPVPDLPMTVQLNLTGPEQRVMLGLDVGALLPASLGFGKK